MLGAASKAWYFCYFSSLACLFPFTNLYLRRLGLSEQQIGLVAAFRPWVSFPSGSLWSGAADKLRAHRSILLFLFATSTLLRLSLAAVGSFGAAMALILVTEFFSAAVTLLVDAAVMAACQQEGDYGRQRLFGAIGWGIFSAVSGAVITHKGIYAAFVCHGALALCAAPPTALLPFGPLHSKLAASSSSPGGSEEKVGADRGAGALGTDVELSKKWSGAWGIGQEEGPGQKGSSRSAAATSGSGDGAAAGGRRRGGAQWQPGEVEKQPLLLSSTPGSSKWPGGLAAATAAAGLGGGGDVEEQQGSRPHDVGALEGPQHAQQAAEAEPSPARPQNPHPAGPAPKVQFWHGMLLLLRNPHALVFFGMVLTMGFGVGNIESYLFLYLDELGAPAALMGLSLSVTCAAEAIVFWFSGKLIQGLGTRLCLHLVFLAFLLRLLCYATLASWGSPWKVLPVELLHGFTFALAWGTGTAYSAKISPPGLEATTLSIFQGLYFGFGYGIGGLVGGAVYKSYGAQQVYWVAFGVMLAGWALGSAAQALLGCWAPSERYAVLSPDDEVVLVAGQVVEAEPPEGP